MKVRSKQIVFVRRKFNPNLYYFTTRLNDCHCLL